MAYGTRKSSRVAKPQAGHYAKSGVEAGSVLREFRIDAAKASELKAGTPIGLDIFTVGQKVDVTGVTIGKGFAGAIRAASLFVEPRHARQLRVHQRAGLDR